MLFLLLIFPQVKSKPHDEAMTCVFIFELGLVKNSYISGGSFYPMAPHSLNVCPSPISHTPSDSKAPKIFSLGLSLYFRERSTGSWGLLV
jgi:hypothetical protein